jgi:aspartyl-tRNA(Asn)/glutamyl-tRNA(Gln) amidotransferase subunit A
MLTVPAITVPAGFTADGRPVGLQVAARHRQDSLLQRVALALQQRRSWLGRMPS